MTRVVSATQVSSRVRPPREKRLPSYRASTLGQSWTTEVRYVQCMHMIAGISKAARDEGRYLPIMWRLCGAYVAPRHQTHAGQSALSTFEINC